MSEKMNEKKELFVDFEMTEGEEISYDTLEEMTDGKGDDENE